ncbi:hypothetical protein B7P43_G15345 [Cryptotermes secundus]|uniref:CCHC-type domain-containing protein n=1 Tax=Cryptotermes secundus TaxID=105785 RepID=A0A2J7R6W5_9NEOP|nr:uncharacterized protein LOC111863051 [Cryptotermes secundus]PNF36572.1 hypothetical protein B7P43_G15345 [Cryptotermes secundus]
MTASPEALNTTFIECNRSIQALQVIGGDVNAYSRVLAPKIFRAFPDDVCRRWTIHVKREQLSEGDIIKLMEFLSVEVEGALTTQKICGESLSVSNLTPTVATFHISSKNQKNIRRIKGPMELFCIFIESRCHWAQDCDTVIATCSRIEKLKAANRCFICLNWGHKARTCSKKGRALCTNCKRSHHRSICNSTEHNTAHFCQVPPISVSNVGVTSSNFIYLQTTRVWVRGPTGLSKLTRPVLDGSSQSSFITKSIRGPEVRNKRKSTASSQLGIG